MVIWGMVYGIALPTLEQTYLEIRGHLHQCQKHVKWLPAVPSEARHKWYSPFFPKKKEHPKCFKEGEYYNINGKMHAKT